MNKLLLIDGSNVLHRAYHALPPLKNAAGQSTGGVYGFLNMLQSMVAKEAPTHVAICFDRGKETFRHRRFPAYKAQRKPTDAELVEQFPLAQEVLTMLGYRCLDSDEYEADDIIGTLAKQGGAAGDQVVIVSGDKDLLQLLGENVTIIGFKKGLNDVDYIDEEVFRSRYGLEPHGLIDLKALMGDSSDNIPGVLGVGEKTALKLLHEYGSLDGVYDHLDALPPNKLKEKLTNDRENAYLSYELATIYTDIDLGFPLEELRPRAKDYAGLKDMYRHLEFRKFLKEIESEAAAASFEEEDSLFAAEAAPCRVEYTRLDDPSDFLQRAQSSAELAVLYEDGAYACALPDGVCILLHTERAEEKRCLDALLTDAAIHKLGHELKTLYHYCLEQGLEFAGGGDDIEIMAYLLDAGQNSYRPVLLLDRYCELDLATLPTEERLTAEAVSAFALSAVLREKLEAEALTPLYEQVERPLVPVLAAMEHEGIRVDSAVLQQMSAELGQKLEGITNRIYDLAGTTFNLNSPKQMGDVLFDKLQLPHSKKTKTGYSTGSEVLEDLRGSHPIIEEILQYRQLSKLKSTYTDALDKLIDPQNGHIHTRFHQTVTTTGRLSSSDPNLQNIPVRLEEGRKLRRAFTAGDEEHLLLAADYSQIELRILAHYADDPVLIESFLQNEDIHARTAREIFGLSDGEQDREFRRRAKAVNFGIIYGISDYGLARDLGISRAEAKDYIDRYFARYPQVAEYLKETVRVARDRGYAETLLGRRRYLPDLNSRNFNVRSFAERTAMNTPLQGTAADVIKGAMVALAQALKDGGFAARIILQVHDELILDCPKAELAAVQPLLRRIMEDTYSLKVPLVVDMKAGYDWYTMEKLD